MIINHHFNLTLFVCILAFAMVFFTGCPHPDDDPSPEPTNTPTSVPTATPRKEPSPGFV